MNRTRDVMLSTGEAIEGAIGLVRRAPAGAYALYYSGTGLWVLGLLFFWGEVTWFHPSPPEMAWAAVGLVLLYLWMTLVQAEFCSVLMALRSGDPIPAFSWKRLFGRWEGQVVVQGFGLVILAVSCVVTFPFGWAYAFLQYASILGSEEAPGPLWKKAWEAAKRNPTENHLFLLGYSIIGMAGLLNVASFLFALPVLAHQFLGLPDLFRATGLSLMNSTFVATVFALVWIAIDPLAKAYYVGALYRHRTQITGEDLLGVIGRKASGRRAAAVALVALALLVPRALGAEEAPQAVDARQLNASITKVLQGHDYEWRLKHIEGDDSRPTVESPNPIAAFFEHIAHVIKHAITEIADWIARHWFTPSPQASGAAASAAGEMVTVLLYILAGAIVLLIGWVIYLVVKQAREPATVLAATALPATPDLSDETIQAAQLPASGWLALAREKMAAGEWRLALRALYLASLADLGADGLITLARSKTNRDYQRELSRRESARGGTDGSLLKRFTERMRLFEDVWYGDRPAEESAVRGWLGDWEGRA